MRVRDLFASIPVARRSFSNIVCSNESSSAPLGSSLTSGAEASVSLRYESLGRLLNALPVLFSPVLIIRLLTHKLFGGMVRKNTTSSSVQMPLSSRHSTIVEHPFEHSLSLSTHNKFALAAKQAAAAAAAKQSRKKSRHDSQKKRSESVAASKRGSKSAEKSVVELSEYMSFIQDTATREHSTLHLEYSKAEELGYNVVAPFSTRDASTTATTPDTPDVSPSADLLPSPEPHTELELLTPPECGTGSTKHRRDSRQPADEQKQRKSTLLQWVIGNKSSVGSGAQSKSHLQSREAKSSVGPVSSKSQISISYASDVQPALSEAPILTKATSRPQKPTSLLSVERYGQKPRSKSIFACGSGPKIPPVSTEKKQEMISAFQREIQNLPTFEMISSDPVDTISPSPMQISPSNSLRNLSLQKCGPFTESQCAAVSFPVCSTSTTVGSAHPIKVQAATGDSGSSSTLHALHPACTPGSVPSPCGRAVRSGTIPGSSLNTPFLMSPISITASKSILQRTMSPTLESYLRSRNRFRKMSLDDNASASTIRRAVLSRGIAMESSPANGTPEAPVAPKLPIPSLRRGSLFQETPRRSVTPTRLGNSPQHRLVGATAQAHGIPHPIPYALERNRNSISSTNCSHYLHSLKQSQREQLNANVVITSAALAATRAQIPTSNTNMTIMSITSSAASRSGGRGSQQSHDSVESTLDLSHSAVMRLFDFWSETCISDLISISNELKEFLRLFSTFGTEYRSWSQQLWCRIKQDVRQIKNLKLLILPFLLFIQIRIENIKRASGGG